MTNEWTLDDLYVSYESKAYQEDWEKLEQTFVALENIVLVDNLETIRKVIELLETQTSLSYKIGVFSGLKLSTNTTDEESLFYSAKLSKFYAEKSKLLSQVKRFIGSVTTDISQDEVLSEYTYLFKEAKAQNQYLLSDDVEEVIATLNQSAGQSWSQLQTFLTSTVEADFDGKKVTLSDIRNLAYAKDGQTRKDAYFKELEMYDTIKEPVAFALNNIKSQVNDIAKLRGYKSPLEETLINSRMQASTLDALIAAIEEKLPVFHKYLKHKAKLLGHTDSLPFYDMFAPIGLASGRKFTVAESRDYLVKHFSKFAKDLADLTQTVYDKNYVDMFPRKGKQGGAFCAGLGPIKQSRILMNFDGNLKNVITMAHELGHAYHNLHIENHRPLNWDYSMPVAETASTFNEALITNSIIAEANDEEKISLLESEIQDSTQIIVDIYSRYLFESAVFEARKERFMFSKDLEELMLDAQKKAYGDGLDHNYLHPYMWLCKGHYYSESLSFYNFPYTFGGLFSKGLYAKYLEKPEGFLEKYQEMLRATPVSSVEDTAKVMGIDLSTKAFWLTALNQIEEKIEKFIALTA